MKKYLFLFDLDSTISKIEILPEISKYAGAVDEIRALTEDTMLGIVPFKHSFLKRVDILKYTKVSEINKIISQIPLNEKVVDFIMKNKDRCFVVTGNLDVWISGLMKRIGMENHCFCSKTLVEDDQIVKVLSVLDKGRQCEQFVQPFVAVGDGDNDSEMARLSEIGIGFGGVRKIAPSLLNNIDYAFYDEGKMVEFLWKLADIEEEE